MIHLYKDPVLFWPYLATCHYGMNWYQLNAVNVVIKDVNPPNYPKLRPIEKYWAIRKRKLLQTKQVAKNERGLENKWIQIPSEIIRRDVQRLVVSLNSKLRYFTYTPVKCATIYFL
ncbi:hypothetical protein Trydic_g11439 [Trypoxylus dichotomus]